MPIAIIDPILSTRVFIAIFVVALLVSIRRTKNSEIFPLAVTQELKGLAILAVVFSHVGYFLSTDQRFLFPLSILAGVAVNLFLFLSGYGLTVSALREKLSALKFYQKRLLKLFTPFWIVALVLFTLDFFLLHIAYPWPYIGRSLIGIFPRADLFLDVNSPFWFITPTLFYYLIFPFVFSRKRPWLSAIIICLVSYLILQLALPISAGVMHLYHLHLLAFPLGIVLASFNKGNNFAKKISDKIASLKIFKQLGRYVLLVVLLIVIGYTAYHSGVGQSTNVEQATSLVTMSALIIFFIMKKFEIKLLHIFGIYSFEIYLIHWPLMERYDLFFRWLPGWIAMIFYLVFFLGLAWVLKFASAHIHRIKAHK